MGRLRISFRAILFTVVAFFGASVAHAQSDICMRLEARLMALDSRPGDSDFGKQQALDKSIRNRREELDRTTADARRAGCMGAFFPRLRAKASCAPMMASIERMRAKLNRLEVSRDRSSNGSSGGNRARGELIRALAANRCGDHYEDYDRPARRGGFLANLFGRQLFRDRGRDGGYFGNASGTFRTLCVRTCDGYYFPISFTTTQSRFTRDQQLCRSMCPGTEVSLYVHRNPGEESEAMVSLAGEPYLALPTALRYRTMYDPACRCGPMVAVAVVSTEPAGFLASYEDDPWGFARGAETPEIPGGGDPPLPYPRPTAGEDPETLANRAGGLIPEPAFRPVAAVADLAATGEKTVRIVGPTYFYAQ